MPSASLGRLRCLRFTATMSLALGIGANAAVFTVIERVLLRPLPVSKPHELFFITDERSPDPGQPAILLSVLQDPR